LYPERWAAASGDRSSFLSEVLVQGAGAAIDVKVRFLHLLAEQKDGRNWQFAEERELRIEDVRPDMPRQQHFRFARREQREESTSRTQEEIRGVIEASLNRVDSGIYKLSLRVVNATEVSGSDPLSRDDASMRALVATHAILYATAGEFISLTNPPEQYGAAVAGCVNEGVWPVLAGEPGSSQWMLVSPIILGDYPQIAPESPGDLFDGTEIDEILTLRVLTLTDQEKAEMRSADPRLRELLERTESLTPEEMMKLHGALRNPHAFASGAGGDK
jgi:hydrogenase maturation protease